MDILTLIILFVFGLAIGSFLNVVASRYDGDHFLFDTKMIGGRSHCTYCGETLRWFELVPLFSYVIQGGKCRRCKKKLSIQYPLIELLSGLIFAFVPLAIIGITVSAASVATGLVIIAILWVVIFEALLVMTIIDVRLGIIPDEINIFLGLLGVLLVAVMGGYYGAANHSFLGGYAEIFGWQGSLWLSHIIGAAFGGIFFGLLIAMTRGKGMGMGDLKLAIPLGFIFGWPDIVFVMMFAFVVGAIVGLFSIARGKNTMKGTLPFGPFLAIGSLIVFFWVLPLFNFYVSTLGIH